MTDTFVGLRDELDKLELHDDRRLINWFHRLFSLADEQGGEIPNRDRMAIKIGKARQLLPNPELGLFPPPGRAERTEWTLVQCINGLITHPRSPAFEGLYELCALNTELWLMG